jgi:hypothetical protein
LRKRGRDTEKDKDKERGRAGERKRENEREKEKGQEDYPKRDMGFSIGDASALLLLVLLSLLFHR